MQHLDNAAPPSLRVCLDLLCCQTANGRHRGIGRYAAGLARALALADSADDRTFALARRHAESLAEIADACRGALPAHRIKAIELPDGRPHILAGDTPAAGMQAAAIMRAYARLCPDVVHDFSPFEPMLARPRIDACAGLVKSATIHDLIPLHYPATCLPSPSARRWHDSCLDRLRAHDLLFAVSEATRRDAIRLAGIPPDRVVTVHGGCDPVFHPGTTSPGQLADLRARLGLRLPYLLFTAGLDPRKNIEGAIRAYALLPGALRSSHQFVVVCQLDADNRDRLMRLASAAGLAESEVVLAGRVSDSDLVALYRDCRAFVFPSHHEGLGLPVLEAISCGAPAIVADNSSLVEIIDRPDARFDSHDDRAIAAKIHQVLSDAGFRRSLVESGLARARMFCWEKTARLVREAWRATLAEKRARLADPSLVSPAPARRPRLACVTPLPPQQTGIADYAAELADSLSAYYDIELFTTASEVEPALAARFPVHPVDALDSIGDRFDRVLYQMGNSEYHAAMFDLMERWPGVVDLHDYHLSSVLAWMGRDIFAQALLSTHGPSVANEFTSAKEQARLVLKHPANRHVFEHALGVIVHTRHALEMADRDYPEGAPAPIELVPHPRHSTGHAGTSRRTEARARLGLAAEEIAICTFGHIAHTKAPEWLLSAFEHLLSARPGVLLRLVYVGKPNETDEIRRFQTELSASPARRLVAITGFASLPDYADWLAAADICVQLRRASRGEASGAVLDAMASGLPVVVNAHGGFAEFPASAVVHAPEIADGPTLAETLLPLVDSPARRSELGRAARRHVEERHDPRAVARRYRAVMEGFFAAGAGRDPRRLVAPLLLAGARKRDVAFWLSDLAASDVCLRPPRAYLDAGDGDPAEALRARELQASLLRDGVEAWIVHPDGGRLRSPLPPAAGPRAPAPAVHPQHGDTARLLPRRMRAAPRLLAALARTGVGITKMDTHAQ